MGVRGRACVTVALPDALGNSKDTNASPYGSIKIRHLGGERNMEMMEMSCTSTWGHRYPTRGTRIL